MKNLPILASVAAFIAFVVVPTPAVAASIFFGVSLLTIFAADYTRTIKPLVPKADLVAFPASARSAQVCELAA